MKMSSILAALGRERNLPPGALFVWTTVRALTGLLGIVLGAAATICGLAAATKGWLSTFAVLLPLGVGLLIAGYDFGFRPTRR